MRLCDLTDQQLREQAARFRRLAEWHGSPQLVHDTNAGLVAAIDELIDRRAAMAYVPAPQLAPEQEACLASR